MKTKIYGLFDRVPLEHSYIVDRIREDAENNPGVWQAPIDWSDIIEAVGYWSISLYDGGIKITPGFGEYTVEVSLGRHGLIIKKYLVGLWVEVSWT